MTPAVVLLANSSLTFSLYDFHLNGVSAQELAKAYSLPVDWVKERLEATRLCLKYQVKLDVKATGTASVKTHRKSEDLDPSACSRIPAMKIPCPSLAL